MKLREREQLAQRQTVISGIVQIHIQLCQIPKFSSFNWSAVLSANQCICTFNCQARLRPGSGGRQGPHSTVTKLLITIYDEKLRSQRVCVCVCVCACMCVLGVCRCECMNAYCGVCVYICKCMCISVCMRGCVFCLWNLYLVLFCWSYTERRHYGSNNQKSVQGSIDDWERKQLLVFSKFLDP